MSKRRRSTNAHGALPIKRFRRTKYIPCYLLDYCTTDARSLIWEALSYADRARLSGTCTALHAEAVKYTKVLKRIFACITSPLRPSNHISWARPFPQIEVKAIATLEIAAVCLSAAGWNTLDDVDWSAQEHVWAITWYYCYPGYEVTLQIANRKIGPRCTIDGAGEIFVYPCWGFSQPIYVDAQCAARRFGYWFHALYSPTTDLPDFDSY